MSYKNIQSMPQFEAGTGKIRTSNINHTPTLPSPIFLARILNPQGEDPELDSASECYVYRARIIEPFSGVPVSEFDEKLYVSKLMGEDFLFENRYEMCIQGQKKIYNDATQTVETKKIYMILSNPFL